MRLIASDFYSLYRPAPCPRRVFLRARGEPEDPPSPYEAVIERLGLRHEAAHLATLGDVIDLSAADKHDLAQRTRAEIPKGTATVYQGQLDSTMNLNGVECEVVGRPDFLIRSGDGYLVRDSKISRRITERDHPEILRQLELYGWLFERMFGMPAAALQVHCGTGEIVDVPYDGGTRALESLRQILALKQALEEPFSPVGWTKCGSCGFHTRCWKLAEERDDVALVFGVDQGIATALRDVGVETTAALLERFDEGSLAEVQRPWGQRTQRIGVAAESIIRMARALSTGEEILVERPDVPERRNYVMFDLEGLPPQLDELDKVFLWGLQVFGVDPGEYAGAMARSGTEGDRAGWEEFLGIARVILDAHGDLPFVHWHHYERTHLDMYIKRFGDGSGVAARVRENLLDLLPITRNSIALPLPSYSLKVVERYVGFTRTMDEYGGAWAMAKYIEATEMEDEASMLALMDQIARYNREDLEATWAVLEWLRQRGR